MLCREFYSLWYSTCSCFCCLALESDFNTDKCFMPGFTAWLNEARQLQCSIRLCRLGHQQPCHFRKLTQTMHPTHNHVYYMTWLPQYIHASTQYRSSPVFQQTLEFCWRLLSSTVDSCSNAPLTQVSSIYWSKRSKSSMSRIRCAITQHGVCTFQGSQNEFASMYHRHNVLFLWDVSAPLSLSKKTVGSIRPSDWESKSQKPY